MMRSKHTGKPPVPEREPVPEPAGVVHPFEEALRSARAHMEDYVAAWTEDLKAAGKAPTPEIGERGAGRLSEAGRRLDRFYEAMRGAQAELEVSVFGHTAEHARDGNVLTREVGEHEEAGRMLVAANAELVRKMADHETLEDRRRLAELGLQ